MEKIETDILKHIYWKKTKVTELEYDENLEWNIVRVYPSIIKHRWMGMGGSITESSCYNYNLLPKEKQIRNYCYGIIIRKICIILLTNCISLMKK